MICVEDRRKMVAEVEPAHRAGALLPPACELVGIRARTIQRWKADSGLERGDGRAHAIRPLPGHALTQAEREQIVHVANESVFAQLPPARILRDAGQDRAILAARSELYTQMKAANPRRWSGHTRNWTPIAAVTLNPERDSVVHAAVHEEKKRSAT